MSFLEAIPSKPRRVFRLETGSAVLLGVLNGATATFIPIIARKELHASPLLLSLMAAAPFIGLLGLPFCVKYTERLGKVFQVVVISLIARAILGLLTFSNTAVGFVAIVCLSSIIAAVGLPAYTALIKAVFPQQWRGRLTALVRFTASFSYMITAALAGVLLARWSYHLVFPIAAGIGIMGLLFFRLIPEPEQTESTMSPPNFRTIFSLLNQDPLFARFVLAFFLFGMGNRMISPAVTLLQVDVLGITSSWVGWLAAIGTLVTSFSFYFWGREVDRRGPVQCALATMLTFILMMLGYMIVPSIPWLIPIAAISGLANASYTMSELNGVMSFGGPGMVQRYTGMYYTQLGIVGLIAPLLGGLLVEIIPLRAVFGLAALFIFMGFLVMLTVHFQKSRQV